LTVPAQGRFSAGSYVPADGPAARHGLSAAEITRRKKLCLWLARLATYRAGLVQRLVLGEVRSGSGIDADGDRYGEAASFHALMAHAAHEIAARLPNVRSRRAQRAASAPAGGEAARLAALLADGPREQPPAAGPWLLGAPHLDDPRDDIYIVTWYDDLYPPGLRQLTDPPPVLFVRGCCAPESLRALAGGPTVAVVGSRAPSAYGLEMTACIAGGLANAGVVVLSGLAMGIDAAAQEEAVRVLGGARVPATVGVLGCGVDIVYPRTNERLFRRTLKHGLLISEFEPGALPRAWRFPARNRVMAAAADAVVIVEGSRHSGSLITAEFALSAGKEVLAVPGEAGRLLSAGPHQMIRDGAALCESAADVLAAIAPSWNREPCGCGDSAQQVLRSDGEHDSHTLTGRFGAMPQGLPGSSREGRLIALLAAADSSADELALAARLPIEQVLAALAELEVSGLVRSQAGGRYGLVRMRTAGEGAQ
jgi:DNA processing protein